MAAADDQIQWGIVSTGSIARTMASELSLVDDARLTAVSSRSAQQAQTFADEFGVERAYGSVEDLLADDKVDIVYVATPHAQHAPIVGAALDLGRAVLCEKAFTSSLSDTENLVQRARDRRVFCMEAMWTRFAPMVARARQIIADGGIGEVRTVVADLGIVAPRDPRHRLWDPALGGGAMLDLGVYPVAFAQMVLGEPATVEAHGSLSPEGVDAEAGLLLGWNGGARALLDISLLAQSAGGATVIGTEGRLNLSPRFHHPTRLVHTLEDGSEQVYEQEHEGRGYVPMLREVQDCLRDGRTESEVMPLDDTVAIMRILDRALRLLGVKYPQPAPVA
ncbi:MAG TPA: Gfo/Idh/MocA family oxidoreductase [Jiangellaceae bacterium]|nr:Gfo/Idh/MocA family oxidoreductase [Jiangellaceae bacterium]